jgi:hypothetical protein
MTETDSGRKHTPQDKKTLSLRKDRRENFGQTEKSSRKMVSLRKAQAQRKLRRTDIQLLGDLARDTVAGDGIALTLGNPEFVKYRG